jgi:hypothetical protein
MVRGVLVLASAGVTDSQPEDVALVVNETAAAAAKLTVCDRTAVEPKAADGVHDAGVGVMVGGAVPVAVMAPFVRLNAPFVVLPLYARE